MQFGIFSVGDVTTDPTSGKTPTEHERIKAMVAIAKKTEEVGLDVFATGEHHNPPFVPSSPTTMLGFIAAQTEPMDHTRKMIELYRSRYEHHGHGSAGDAIVGVGGQAFMRKNSQDAVREFRPHFDNAPVYGHGPSLEDFSTETTLACR